MLNFQGMSDEELLLLLQGGDVRAFNEVYARYFPMLFRYAFNILREEEECSDAIQEIFVWIWENREKLEIGSIKGYLLASVKYRMARIIHTSRRRAEILATNVEPDAFTLIDGDLEVKELKKAIHDFVGALPQRAREIFLLSREQHCSNKEIAARLGISEKTVENQITIALKRLRADLPKRFHLFFFL